MLGSRNTRSFCSCSALGFRREPKRNFPRNPFPPSAQHYMFCCRGQMSLPECERISCLPDCCTRCRYWVCYPALRPLRNPDGKARPPQRIGWHFRDCFSLSRTRWLEEPKLDLSVEKNGDSDSSADVSLCFPFCHGSFARQLVATLVTRIRECRLPRKTRLSTSAKQKPVGRLVTPTRCNG